MSSTTQILHNSPALHALKREQLVNLCKIHSIKANGKNTELIERLKQRATQLPIDDSSNTEDAKASDADELNGDDEERPFMPRPSEQWEIVMDDIEEVEEGSNSGGTLTSLRSLGGKSQGTSNEFGTGNSKASTVSSSIKAFATSLGIKRTASTKSAASSSRIFSSKSTELESHAVPYSSLPPSDVLPQTDFKFTTPDASILDEADMHPAVSTHHAGIFPVPATAGLPTTIRLVSTPFDPTYAPTPPRLQPFQTTFDIEMGTPLGKVGIWPASPAVGYDSPQTLYPKLPLDDLPLRVEIHKAVTAQEDADMPGGLPKAMHTPRKTSEIPTKDSAMAKSLPSSAPVDVFSPIKASAAASVDVNANANTPNVLADQLDIPRRETFLFGSPLPQHNRTNKDFGKAAASVLEEMNRRLADSGVRPANATALAPSTSTGTDVFGNIGGHQRTDSTDRFAQAHAEAFNKMDSIATHYAARRRLAAGETHGTKKRKSDALGLGPSQVPATKRRSGAAGTKAISNGVRKKMGVPGAFGDDDNDADDNNGPNDDCVRDAGDRRSSKRIRVVSGDDVHKGRRVSLRPSHEEMTQEERAKKEKEKDAIRRKLEANKARRRSSRGRVSVGGRIAPVDKGKTSRFGFLSSAKTLVKNVWNLGAGTSKVSTVPSMPATKAPPLSKVKAPQLSVPAPIVNSSRPRPTSNSAPSTSTKSSNDNTRVTSGNSSLKVPGTTSSRNGTATSIPSSSRARSPIPSFPPSSRTSTAFSARSNVVSLPSAGTVTSRAGSSVGVSSIGTRTSITSGSRSACVSSIGTRHSNVAGSTSSKRVSSIGVTTRVRTSSTLLAPTASSLAKMQGSIRSIQEEPAPRKLSGLPISMSRTGSGSMASVSVKSALDQITNSPRPPSRIFSKPLSGFGSPSSMATPDKNPSLDAVATKLAAGTPSAIPRVALPPRPKTLVARKPRISRSKVAAKLGTQRAVSNGVSGALSPTTRTRSSFGAARRSLGGVKGGRSSVGNNVAMSAKKRARQNEYARRKSLAPRNGEAGGSVVKTGESNMNLDD